jgi:hypothetical protein
VLIAHGVEIRGGSKWINEKNHTHRILRRWDAGKSSKTIAEKYKLQREGVARVIAANRPYDQRIRKLLGVVFGAKAESRRFLATVACRRNTGRCAICHAANNDLVKDYSRQSGTLRDLLCKRCSQALGCFDHDTSKMFRAIAYLKTRTVFVPQGQERSTHESALSGRNAASSASAPKRRPENALPTVN